MQRLNQNSEKRHTFTRGKNRQEERALKVVHSILEKNFLSKNALWLKEFIEVNKTLDEIKSNTNLMTDEFTEASFTSNSTRTYNGTRKTSMATLAFYNDSEKYSSVSKTSKKSIRFNRNELDSSSFRSNKTKSSRYTIARFEDLSEINVSLEKPVESNYLKNRHNEMIFNCSIFPCVTLKSYTSMIGEHKDRTKEQLECVAFKSVLNDRPQSIVSKVRYSNSAKSYSRTERDDESEDGDFKSTTADNEFLFRTKSIRRPLKKGGSATNDLLFKIKSLQTKVNYCQEQNAINFKSSDRNVRYGAPQPRSNIQKQMRILSQFDS